MEIASNTSILTIRAYWRETPVGRVVRLCIIPEHWKMRAWWLVVGWTVLFWRLGYLSLLDPDEAHYAQLTREMMRSRHWLVPLLDGAPLIDKPAFFHWLQGLSIGLLGETEFAVRLPSALAAVGLLAIVRWAAAALFDRRSGEWAGLLFLTIPLTFGLGSIAIFDMVFSCFLFGALACLLVAATRRSRRVEAAGYAMLTVAVMVKGPVALILVGVFMLLAHAVGAEARDTLRWLRWKAGLLVVLIAASPWFVWMYLNFHQRFVAEYFFAGNLYYLTQPQSFSRRAVSSTFFVRTFLGGFFPCSLIVVGRAIDILRRRIVASTAERLLWLWVAVVVSFFSIARFKLDHYIFPAAPACAMLAALAWRTAVVAPREAAAATRAMVRIAAMLLIVGGALGGAYLFSLDLELPAVAILLPMSLAAGGVAVFALRGPTGIPRTPAPVIICLTAAYGLIVLVGFPTLERVRPMAAIGRVLSKRVPADGEIATYRLERWRGSLRYYAHRPVRGLENQVELDDLLKSRSPVYIVMLRSDFETLRQAGMPVRALLRRRAVVKTTGRGLRKQQWDFLVVATNEPENIAPVPRRQP
jgi:4-amino-4-deoxy-L-arabinose transferase-like glycosyltransferase